MMKIVKGQYQDDEGGLYDRVTSIVGVLAKPGLIAWAAKLAAETGDPTSHTKESQSAKERGTAAHLWIKQQYVAPDNNPPDDILPYHTAWNRWRENWPHHPIVMEKTVRHSEHMYAGTMDMLADHEGKQFIVDFKTTAKIKGRAWPDYRLQVEAYRMALEHENDAPGSVAGVGIVTFDAHGEYRMDMWENSDAGVVQEAFRAALCLYRWNRAYSRKGYHE